MEQIPFWEANKSSASQEIPRILRTPKAHYRFKMCHPRCVYKTNGYGITVSNTTKYI